MAFTSIDDPTIHFQSKIYTGTGSSNSVTLDGDTNMQPDWVWIKDRSEGNWHNLYDVVRGVTKRIFSNQTSAEETQAAGLTAFGSNGFTVGSNVDVNKSSNNYVAWNWKAGGSASSNGDGDVTASVSANTTAGFSIVKFTASSSSGNMTVGHGLGATPKMVIVKDIGATGNWQTYFEGIGTANQQYLKLNATSAVSNISGLWGAGMTSSLIGIGVGVAVDASESDIAYCFAEKQGYSKFGQYVGNGNVDGTFVYTGFKPAWVMVKRTDSTSDWLICDNKRDPFNGVFKKLFPNLAQGDDSYESFDFVSNGFKIRSSGTGHNASGANMIFMAFAESPFVNSNSVPNNAE